MSVDVRIHGRMNELKDGYLHIRINVKLLGEEGWPNG